MKRIDRVILGDLLGPWIFGVAMFTLLIAAGSVLFQFTNFIVKGISPLRVFELLVLSLPGFMAMTFPMAMLLACLLGFGRLSGDSEITAMRACGTSLLRIMLPVALFGVFVSCLTFVFRNNVVPFTMTRAQALQEEFASQIEATTARTTTYDVIEGGVLRAQIIADRFDLGTRTLNGVLVVMRDREGKRTLALQADRLVFENDKRWQITGWATLLDLQNLTYRAEIRGGVWPTEIVSLDNVTPEDIAAERTKNFDSQTVAQLQRSIAEMKKNPRIEARTVRNAEYQLWNKFALPLAALVYALVGAPLGIRNHRTGASAGFWIAIVIIFAYFLLGNFLALWAQGGAISPAFASFFPVLLGTVVGVYLIGAKDR